MTDILFYWRHSKIPRHINNIFKYIFYYPVTHQIKIRIRIRLKVTSWILIRINLQMTSQNLWNILS
jgi:hypothetical protein